MNVAFTAHNIILDNGDHTLLGTTPIQEDPNFISARKMLDLVFPGDKSQYRLADLGCLEGGHSVELARMGFNVVGLEVRDSNIAACQYVKSRVNLPNLQFVQDDVWNVGNYGDFDAAFCVGLLYHLDNPVSFLRMLSGITKKLLLVHAHFATDAPIQKFNLSEISTNEGAEGRWFTEFSEDTFGNRDSHKWSSWNNKRSFWLKREHLLQSIKAAGFDIVLEQYDGLGNIAESMGSGYYKTDNRGSFFVGIKDRGSESS